MLRRFVSLAAAVAALAIPATSYAATCTGPVSQNCTFLKDGQTVRCTYYVGTASGDNGSYVCASDKGVIISIDY